MTLERGVAIIMEVEPFDEKFFKNTQNERTRGIGLWPTNEYSYLLLMSMIVGMKTLS